MEAQGRAFRRPARRGAAAFGVGRQDQALIAAPAGADAEQVERVDHRVDRRLGRRLEDHAEQSAGAEKVALPQRVARVFRQSRVEHARDFRPGLQPARHGERILLVPLQPHRQCAQPAQREIDIVGAGAVAEIGGHRAHRQVHLLVGDDRAEHHVGVADDVFGRRVDRDIDAVLERAEQVGRGPGVVHQHLGAGFVRRRGDRRHVLHLEGQRARGFDDRRPGCSAASAGRSPRRSAGRNRSSRRRSGSAPSRKSCAPGRSTNRPSARGRRI